jgi:mannose-6-phosphate isomerase-like protein (cupin superfamily)
MVRRNSILVPESEARRGEMGQLYLAAGQNVGLRLWDESADVGNKACSARDYETIGYVIAGRALLRIENRSVELKPGDSWVVEKGLEHSYEILETFRAIEATSPPARETNLDDAAHNRGQHYSPEDVLA